MYYRPIWSIWFFFFLSSCNIYYSTVTFLSVVHTTPYIIMMLVILFCAHGVVNQSWRPLAERWTNRNKLVPTLYLINVFDYYCSLSISCGRLTLVYYLSNQRITMCQLNSFWRKSLVWPSVPVEDNYKVQSLLI